MMDGLKQLGQRVTESLGLEVIPIDQPVSVRFVCHEFTCRCPVTGQPDFGTIEFAYGADEYIVESKSVKLWLETYRERGIFHEHLAAELGRHLIDALDPHWLWLKVKMNSRGGIAIDALYTYDVECDNPWMEVLRDHR